MAPHSRTLAWKIPWTVEPRRLQSMGSQRVGHDWSDLAAAERGSEDRVAGREDKSVGASLKQVLACWRCEDDGRILDSSLKYCKEVSWGNSFKKIFKNFTVLYEFSVSLWCKFVSRHLARCLNCSSDLNISNPLHWRLALGPAGSECSLSLSCKHQMQGCVFPSLCVGGEQVLERITVRQSSLNQHLWSCFLSSFLPTPHLCFFLSVPKTKNIFLVAVGFYFHFWF